MKIRKSYRYLGLVLVGVLVIAFFILPVIDRRKEMAEELQAKTQTLAKYQAVITHAPETEKETKKASEEMKRFRSLLINEKTEAIGYSRLNSHLQDLVRRSGMELTSIKQLGERKLKGFSGLAVQVNAAASTKQLKDLLQGLSTGLILVSIDTIDISVINVNNPDRVRVKLEITGYREL